MEHHSLSVQLQISGWAWHCARQVSRPALPHCIIFSSPISAHFSSRSSLWSRPVLGRPPLSKWRLWGQEPVQSRKLCHWRRLCRHRDLPALGCKCLRLRNLLLLPNRQAKISKNYIEIFWNFKTLSNVTLPRFQPVLIVLLPFDLISEILRIPAN